MQDSPGEMLQMLSKRSALNCCNSFFLPSLRKYVFKQEWNIMVFPNAIIRLSDLCLFLCLLGELWFFIRNYLIHKQLHIETVASGKERVALLSAWDWKLLDRDSCWENEVLQESIIGSWVGTVKHVFCSNSEFWYFCIWVAVWLTLFSKVSGLLGKKAHFAIFPVLGDGGRVESILPARTSGAQHALVTSPSICELLPWLTWIRELAPSSTETFSVYNLSKRLSALVTAITVVSWEPVNSGLSLWISRRS